MPHLQPTNVEDLYNSLDAFMPYYFRFINPVIHQMDIPEGSLNENQIKVLMAAEKVGKVAPGKISEIFLIPKTSLTTIIRSLLDLGLIVKERKTGDGRTFQISLTPRGKSLIEKKKEENVEYFGHVFPDLEDDEARDIICGLQAMKMYFEKRGRSYEI